MSPLDRQVLAERVAAVERHLARVEARLPATEHELAAGTDASDAVVLHLWQAVQITIDVATALAIQLGLGTPLSYADAFVRLADAGILDASLAARLVQACGFRNVVAHAYEGIDMARVHRAARQGPEDLRALLRAAASRI
jgi:uncharacterized protein YutE (UPF0331/DUF86 family)